MVSKLLAIQAHIDQIKWIFIVELRNIRKFTHNIIIFVMPLRTDPVLHWMLGLSLSIIFEPNSDTLNVL